jgi:hypothetical protein
MRLPKDTAAHWLLERFAAQRIQGSLRRNRTMKINLGDKCKDNVTGFEGIVTVRSEYISGCTRVGLQPPVGSDGKIPEAQYFDEPMLTLVQSAACAAMPSDRGGPRDVPRQHSAPVR